MTGHTMRFLRKKMRLTQHSLGTLLGYAQPINRVSALERGEKRITKPVGRLVLALYHLAVMGKLGVYREALRNLEGEEKRGI